jgi:hypothetical protein
MESHFIFHPASHIASSRHLDFNTLWKKIVPYSGSYKAIFRPHFQMQLQNRSHQKQGLSCEVDNQQFQELFYLSPGACS